MPTGITLKSVCVVQTFYKSFEPVGIPGRNISYITASATADAGNDFNKMVK